MKKVFGLIIIIMSCLLLNVKADELPEVTDHEKVTIYIFRGHGCSHCYEALEFFNDNQEDYADYFEVKAYEVWNNSDNSTLMNDVAETFGDDVGGVPYIVVGDSYSVNGFSQSIGSEIIKAALAEYENEDYTDVVKELSKGNDSLVKESLEEACKEEGIIVDPKDTIHDGIIIFVIFTVILGGGAGLIALARKK